MSENTIRSAKVGELTNTMDNYEVDPMVTDGATGQKETEYTNQNFPEQLGHYKQIPELRAVIDALARWTVGKGILASKEDTLTMDLIKGFGKDTFNTIIENQSRVSKIAGDSFAHIIRSENIIVNLKPLDPSTIKTVANKKGIILRYEQIAKNPGDKKKVIHKFDPEEIFHLSRNRTADEIHGISLIEALKNIIHMRNEAMEDYRIVLHRHVKPLVKFMLDTDDETKINAFIVKADYAINKGENLYLPMGTVEHEIISVPTNATLSPLAWIKELNNYFFQAAGVPQIIVGGSQEMTEATAKVAYVCFEQTIREEQLYLTEQIGHQLALTVIFEFPASLTNDMISDEKKDGEVKAATPEDTNVQGVPLQGVNL